MGIPMDMKAGPQNRSAQAIFYCLLATAIFTAADLGSKDWAQSSLSRPNAEATGEACKPDANGQRWMQHDRHGRVELIEGYLEFRYAENCGAAFGMLNDAPKWMRAAVFMSAGAVAVGALFWMFVIGSGGTLFAWSVPLIVSGALGNMIDRVRLGYVVDFIRFHLHDGWEWPTFNVADSTITVGVVLLLIDGLRQRAAEPARSGSTSTQPASAKAP